MSTDRIKALDSAIRAALLPQLSERGFAYEAGARTFRKTVGECTQVIHVQVGVRSLEGRFSINLGVFHPTYRMGAESAPPPDRPREFDCWPRERLAVLRDTLITRLFRRRISHPDSFLQWWLVTPSDKWWPFTADEGQSARQLMNLHGLLFTRGTGWLDAKSDVAALRTADEQAKSKVPAGD